VWVEKRAVLTVESANVVRLEGGKCVREGVGGSGACEGVECMDAHAKIC
jgi:hypothetical protein